MSPTVRFTLAIALTASLALVGCTRSTQRAAEPTAAVPPQRIVFDMGHGEIFGAEDQSELGQSRAVGRMSAAGFDVVVNDDAITPHDLDGAAGLVLAGPMQPLNPDEYTAINQFVQSGGTVLLTIHVPFPVMSVPAHWGLPVVPAIIQSEKPLDTEVDPTIFVARNITPGRLTENVSNVLVVSGWPVSTAQADAELVVSTGSEAWVDRDGDGARTEADSTEPLGIVGAKRLGKGYVVVAGDDAIFANIAIDQVDNAALLDNILALMSQAQDV